MNINEIHSIALRVEEERERFAVRFQLAGAPVFRHVSGDTYETWSQGVHALVDCNTPAGSRTTRHYYDLGAWPNTERA